MTQDRKVTRPIMNDEIADILSGDNLSTCSQRVSKEMWMNYAVDHEAGFEEAIIKDMYSSLAMHFIKNPRFPVDINNRPYHREKDGAPPQDFNRDVDFRLEIFALNKHEWTRLVQYVRTLETQNKLLKETSPVLS